MSSIRKLGGFTLLACLVCRPLAQAQDANVVADLKANLVFSSWPEPAGPANAKQGFAFNPASYPGLAGFGISGDTLISNYLTYGLIRNVTLTNGVGSLTIRIGVGVDTPVNGHELFLRSGPADSDLPYYDAHQRGDTNGIAVGDLNFVLPGATSASLNGYIAFMRHNVFCEIADDAEHPSGVDVMALAAQIDAAFTAQPSMSATEFDATRPVASLTPATTTLSSRAMGSTTAIAADSDPTGTSGPLTRRFVSANLNVQDPGGEPAIVVITASSTVGNIPLQVVAVNRFLQFGTATVFFTVTP